MRCSRRSWLEWGSTPGNCASPAVVQAPTHRGAWLESNKLGGDVGAGEDEGLAGGAALLAQRKHVLQRGIKMGAVLARRRASRACARCSLLTCGNATAGKVAAVAVPVVMPVGRVESRWTLMGVVNWSMLRPGVRLPVLMMPSTVTLYCDRGGGMPAQQHRQAVAARVRASHARRLAATSLGSPSRTLVPGSRPVSGAVRLRLGKVSTGQPTPGQLALRTVKMYCGNICAGQAVGVEPQALDPAGCQGLAPPQQCAPSSCGLVLTHLCEGAFGVSGRGGARGGPCRLGASEVQRRLRRGGELLLVEAAGAAAGTADAHHCHVVLRGPGSGAVKGAAQAGTHRPHDASEASQACASCAAAPSLSHRGVGGQASEAGGGGAGEEGEGWAGATAGGLQLKLILRRRKNWQVIERCSSWHALHPTRTHAHRLCRQLTHAKLAPAAAARTRVKEFPGMGTAVALPVVGPVAAAEVSSTNLEATRSRLGPVVTSPSTRNAGVLELAPKVVPPSG